MKKNKSLSNFEMHNSSVSSKNAIHKRTKDAEAIYAETSEKIKRGLEKATASTGTPIASLKGGAKYMAQLSNVGGGSVKIGGGGIKEGFNTFAKNHMANAPGATSYNVQLYAGTPGSGYRVATYTPKIPINNGASFYALTVGQNYYFMISSDDVGASGCTATYSYYTF